MRVVTSKSKNAESFYISKGYVNDKGVSTSVIVRKLGTLKELLPEHGPTRDDVMAWAKEQARIETLKYKQEKEEKQIKLTFHADRQLDYDKQVFYRGGYLFLQSIYYQMQMNKICRKLKQKYKFKYDINAILSGLIYANRGALQQTCFLQDRIRVFRKTILQASRCIPRTGRPWF